MISQQRPCITAKLRLHLLLQIYSWCQRLWLYGNDTGRRLTQLLLNETAIRAATDVAGNTAIYYDQSKVKEKTTQTISRVGERTFAPLQAAPNSMEALGVVYWLYLMIIMVFNEPDKPLVMNI